MKILLIFITRLFLSAVAFSLLISCILIASVLIEEYQLFFRQMGESLLKLFGVVLSGLGAWYIGKPQIKWWKKFLAGD